MNHRAFACLSIRNFLAASVLFATFACGARSSDHPDWGERFEAAGVRQGCLTIYDQNANRYHRYNAERCARGFLPASTYKIFNSLVALETGVASDVAFTLPWDGTQRWLPVWNQDHDMRSAMRNSVVWYYQEIARRIGTERMSDYLRRAEYGNGDISAGIDRFWLEGGFRISPDDQVEFLRRLRAGSLPFRAETQEQVRSILVEADTAAYRLYAKTGLAIREPGDKIGWWVGYLEQNENVYFFALNIAGSEEEELMEFAAKRKALVREILKSQFDLL